MKNTIYILTARNAASWMPPHPCRWLTFLAAVSAGMLLCAADAPQLPPLTTVPGSPRLPGKFVWADLVTDDVPAAQKFYAGLFGWTLRNFGG